MSRNFELKSLKYLLISIILIGSLIETVLPEPYTKLRWVECGSSRKHAILTCFLKDEDIRNSLLSFALTIRKPITRLLLDLDIYFEPLESHLDFLREHGNAGLPHSHSKSDSEEHPKHDFGSASHEMDKRFTHLFGAINIDFCFIFDNILTFFGGYIGGYLEFINNATGTPLIQTCPVTENIEINNFPTNLMSYFEGYLIFLLEAFEIPYGVYRFYLHGDNEEDKNIFTAKMEFVYSNVTIHEDQNEGHRHGHHGSSSESHEHRRHKKHKRGKKKIRKSRKSRRSRRNRHRG